MSERIKNILVDDAAAIIDLLGKMLKIESYDILAVSNGADCLKKPQAKTPI
ncbi:MAG: hypothetical protein JW734_03780 [Candidatus Omnitrophica bacterium]|nr:hypothetical protein [Candidatus Omnitrophota bacterium]